MRTAAALLGLALLAGGCTSSHSPKVDASAAGATTTSTTGDVATVPSSPSTTSTTAAPSKVTTAPTAAARATSTTARPASATTTTTAPRPASTTTTTATSGGGPTAAITIQNFAFSPAALNVSVGTKVTATNLDGPTHTWTADDGSWDSGGLPTHASFSHTFTKAGTFKYHCSIHSSMTGVVTVS
jgi:plastocyanin